MLTYCTLLLPHVAALRRANSLGKQGKTHCGLVTGADAEMVSKHKPVADDELYSCYVRFSQPFPHPNIAVLGWNENCRGEAVWFTCEIKKLLCSREVHEQILSTRLEI